MGAVQHFLFVWSDVALAVIVVSGGDATFAKSRKSETTHEVRPVEHVGCPSVTQYIPTIMS